MLLWVIEIVVCYIEEYDKGEMIFGGQKYQSLSEFVCIELLIVFLFVVCGLILNKVKFIGIV